MGNPDLAIVFNNGLVNFFISGGSYNTTKEAIQMGINKYNNYWNEHGDFDGQVYEIESINIYALELQ